MSTPSLPDTELLQNFLRRKQALEVYRGFQPSEILARELELCRFWIYIAVAGAMLATHLLARWNQNPVPLLLVAPLFWLFARQRRLEKFLLVGANAVLNSTLPLR